MQDGYLLVQVVSFLHLGMSAHIRDILGNYFWNLYEKDI